MKRRSLVLSVIVSSLVLLLLGLVAGASMVLWGSVTALVTSIFLGVIGSGILEAARSGEAEPPHRAVLGRRFRGSRKISIGHHPPAGCPGALGSAVCISCDLVHNVDGGLICTRYKHFLLFDEFWRRVEIEVRDRTKPRRKPPSRDQEACLEV